MDLLEVRTEFVKRTGRYDLVVDNTDYVDDGANFFIRSGQKLLDRMEHVSGSGAKVYKVLEDGDWYAVFRDCRAVKAVYAANDEDRWQLVKKELGWLLLEYEGKIADIDTGTPKYYSPALLRRVPEQEHLMTLSRVVDETVEDLSGTHYEYNGILFMPPADEKFILEIHGLFYSHPLKEDSDESYWSVNFEAVLIMAACYMVEVFNRNTEGMKDWLAAIKVELSTLGMDLVEDDIAGISQMEG